MRMKVMILGCFAGVILISGGYEALKAPLAAFGNTEDSQGRSEADKGRLKIGIVDVRKVFEGSKRVVEYRQKTLGEQQTVRARWEALAKEIEADKAGLNTLIRSSSDYLAQVKEMFEKQANLQAEQEFYKEKMKSEELRITEEFYRDILRETVAVAKEKDLDLVFEGDEPKFPTSSLTQLEFTMGTHKLLYISGGLDITDAVLARVDAIKRVEE